MIVSLARIYGPYTRQSVLGDRPCENLNGAMLDKCCSVQLRPMDYLLCLPAMFLLAVVYSFNLLYRLLQDDCPFT